MPIAPLYPFFKLTCNACGWSDVTYQASDVIPRPQVCPKCGERQLVFSKAGAFESMRAFAREYLLRKMS